MEGETEGIKKESEDGNGREDGACFSINLDDDAPRYPERPANWIHEFLLIYCLIGRPSTSEDSDLRTARKTSGPPKRKEKRKSGSFSSTEDSETVAGSAGPGGNLDSSAIRTFTGAGEGQSRAQVKKEIAAVGKNVAQERHRQKRLAYAEKLVDAVLTLSEAVAAKQRLEAEAAVRGCEVAAQARKNAEIANLRGKMEFAHPSSPQYMELRSAILAVYQQPVSDFMAATASAATTPTSGSGAAPPATSAVTSPATYCTAFGTLPGFSGGGGGGAA